MIEKLQPITALPEGYRATHVLPEYEQATVDVLNAYSQWMFGEPATTLELMRAEWEEEGFNRETDTVIVIGPDGRVVGTNHLYDVTTLHVRMFAWIAVDPEMIGSGVEDYLVEWGIERARKNIEKTEPGKRVVLHMSVNSTCPPMRALLEAHHMHEERNFYRMVIDLDQPIPDPQPPDGIVIRSIQGEAELREAILGVRDSFRDHWGYIEEPADKYVDRWVNRLKTDPFYDPAYYFIALDGDSVAGISLCYPFTEEDPDMAWVGSLGVRREWRKRGLALALLRHSFLQFQRRGSLRAGLGVDATSMTGAVKLYEKAGMHVARMNIMYEYELRPGEDLMRKKLEG